MKSLGGVVVLCLSVVWAIFWCSQFSNRVLTYDGYWVPILVLASLALIPVLWATSLIDRAWRAPREPVIAAKPFVAPLVQKPSIEANTERDVQFAGFSPGECSPVKTHASRASSRERCRCDRKSLTPAALSIVQKTVFLLTSHQRPLRHVRHAGKT